MRTTEQPGGDTRCGPGDDEPIDLGVALRDIDERLAALAPEMVPERIPAHALRDVTARLASIERRARGAKLVLRKAAADSGAWKAAGARSAADAVAKQEGISAAQARAEIEASSRLAHLPATRDAVVRGEMSLEKAKAVAEGAAADRASEQRLLDTARRGDLRATQDEARKAVIRADERSGGGRSAGVRRRRSLTTWLTIDGEGHGHWRVPPDMHHRFLAALEPYVRQARRNAKAAGTPLPPEAVMADAMDLLARDVLLDDGCDPEQPDAPASPRTPADDAPDTGTGTDGGGSRSSVGPRPTEPEASPPNGPSPIDEETAPPPPDARSATPGTTTDQPTASGAAPQDDSGGTERRAPAGGVDETADVDRGGTTASGSEPPAIGSPAARPEGAVRARTTAPAPPPSATGTSPAGSTDGRRAPRPARARRAPVEGIILVDLDALRRGYTLDGETCEVQGIGSVPVEMARDMLRDALLRLVVTGTDVTVVSTVTRHVPAEVRAALLARDKGRCVVPGCGATRGLQIDHAFVDFARGGPTRLTNLDLLCGPHHFRKTHLGWRLGWDARTGWSFTPPDSDAERGPP